MKYIVKQGDTLWNIAKTELGSAKRYKEIVAANRLKTASLTEGMRIVIPKGGSTDANI